ncbi:MAG: tRNA nucleotidyltransferase [Candidatus Magasanikbacteria bacterium CG11_big_fil_rev_8_21_14_0_20_39_34]|uniref:tRNA nucleotidyltransferase n=1 Tax=Candidatus Magasanikbacteria bacterium CG11_big_fil_rev_8_21_14_0_20_39_34 TaxID=1974653 RepID=A0A2H0N6Z8_9BACT|nr:MAG: tRNA nucleotidyltransferase [Candidatus Magasanikbacteria bacterium CG11_big_fil_rev_8_21_14_0_20_39_34]
MTIQHIFQFVSKASQASATEVYVVGGFVRDELLGIPDKKDLDFVVLGSGIEFARKFDEMYVGESALVEFPDFDTARFVIMDEKREKSVFELEFAGARTEKYKDNSRKPEVMATSLEEDLKRRDFTVNAMARKVIASGLSSKIVDPFHGQQNLKNKTLQTPLDPDETFFEDPLRMLRAARFAAQLNFSLKEEVLLSIHKNRERIKIISQERIQEELMKLLATNVPSVGLQLLHGTKLLDEFLPEVAALAGVEEVKGYKHKENLSHTFAVVDNIATYSKKPLLRFAGLMHDIAKPETKKFDPSRGWTFDMHEHLGKKMTWEICKRLRMKKQDIQYVAELVRWHLQPIALMDEGVTDSAVRRLIVNLQEDLDDLLILCRADVTTGNQSKKKKRLTNYDRLEKRIAEVLEKDKLRAFQSPVRGEEIMEICGLKPGPTVGEIKEEIERAILDGEIPNEYEAAKEYFEKMKDRYIQKAKDWEFIDNKQ